MSATIDRRRFESAYAAPAPWDIGRPHQQFVAIHDRVASPVLDAGCGTGDIVLHYAERGHQVTGIDFVEEAIRRARGKAVERDVAAEFLVMDALTLGAWDRRFATVFDSGLFHVFSDEDRRRYVEGLAAVMSPGGYLFLSCFSDAEPPGQGPRRVSLQELFDAFADGFEVETVEESQFEINPLATGLNFSEGGPKTWFATIRRLG